MQETKVENFDGYLVHTYNVECPYKEAINESRRKNSVLRHLAFAALAPIAFFADMVIGIFH